MKVSLWSGLFAFDALSPFDLIAQLRKAQIDLLNVEFVPGRIGARQKLLVSIKRLLVLAEIIMRCCDEEVRGRNFGAAGRNPFEFGQGVAKSLQLEKRHPQVRAPPIFLSRP